MEVFVFSNISENNAKVLLEKAKLQKKSAPVFIIGNGPSLDQHLAYIKANEDNAIIISIGKIFCYYIA